MVTSNSQSVPPGKLAPNKPADELHEVRRRLLEVAMVQFGQAGFRGASTRAIAGEAGTIMSSITYHFGSKHGLYLATARHVSCLLQTWMISAFASATSTGSTQLKPPAARRTLHRALERAAEVFNGEETTAASRFMVMQQADAGEGFDLLHDQAVGPMIDIIVSLLLAAVGHCIAEDEARVISVALFGQVLAFRLSRASVLRANRWSELGPGHLAMIKRVIANNLDAILDQIVEQRSGCDTSHGVGASRALP